MRWVWRGLAAFGALALAGLLAYGIYAQVRLHQEVRNICSQFSGVNCKHYPDDCCVPRGTGLWEVPDDEGGGYDPWSAE